MIEVVKLHGRRAWDGHLIYIGRPSSYRGRGMNLSILGNPFIHKERYLRSGVSLVKDLPTAVWMFRRFLWLHLHQEGSSIGQAFWDLVETIRDNERHGSKTYLGCFCKPEACHGDVLKAAIEKALGGWRPDTAQAEEARRLYREACETYILRSGTIDDRWGR